MEKGQIFMWNSKRSVNFSLVVVLFVSGILLALLLFGPKLFELYMVAYRGFSPSGEAIKMLKKVFGICFYSSAPFAATILYCLIRLLLNIKKNSIFILENAKYLKVVSWCCFLIAIITLVGGIFYMPLLSIAAAGCFTGVLLRVLKNVMEKAIELKEENELTI